MRIFGRNTTTDEGLRSRSEVLRLLKLAVFSAGRPIREIHFEGLIGPSYVEASDARVKKLVDEFLSVEDTPGPARQHRAQEPPEAAASASGNPRGRRASRTPPASAASRRSGPSSRALGKSLPVLFPTAAHQGLASTPGRRACTGSSPTASTYRAYRMVIDRAVGVGEYYGVQGTTWKDPPILDDASETREIGGREYELHYDGDRLRLVAWHTDKGSYWISNTLLQSLSEAQMMGIARSVRAL